MSDEAEVQAEVLAGGGLVRRRRADSEWELAIVHRPRYDDWSLPKGKVKSGETLEEAALREVEEETGLVCRLLDPCGDATYRDRRGRFKLVRYWVMEVVLTGTFEPSDEVDAMRWSTVPEALRSVTYERDRELVAAVLGGAPSDGPQTSA